MSGSSFLNLTIDKNLLIKKELHNNGLKSVVYLVSDPTGKEFVCKTINSYLKNSSCCLLDEYQKHSSLNHKNILEIYIYKENSLLENPYFLGKKINFFTMEYAKYGDFFSFVSKYCIKHKNNDIGIDFVLARSIFKIIVDAVEYLHNCDICHRDLKLENIFICENGCLKIADFGCAANINEELYDIKGTDFYMAPEIFKNTYNKKTKYNGIKSDIFSLGVLLFAMVFNKFPFNFAGIKDPRYNFIVKKDYKIFWEIFENKKYIFEEFDSFKNLIEGMLMYNPEERITLTRIKEHPWMKGICFDENKVYQIILETFCT